MGATFRDETQYGDDRWVKECSRIMVARRNLVNWSKPILKSLSVDIIKLNNRNIQIKTWKTLTITKMSCFEFHLYGCVCYISVWDFPTHGDLELCGQIREEYTSPLRIALLFVSELMNWAEDNNMKATWHCIGLCVWRDGTAKVKKGTSFHCFLDLLNPLELEHSFARDSRFEWDDAVCEDASSVPQQLLSNTTETNCCIAESLWRGAHGAQLLRECINERGGQPGQDLCCNLFPHCVHTHSLVAQREGMARSADRTRFEHGAHG